MQLLKFRLNKSQLDLINVLAMDKNLKIEQTADRFFFPLSALPHIPLADQANKIFKQDSIKNTTVFFDLVTRKAEITSFVFDTAFEDGGYHVEFEISEETLMDILSDLGLAEIDRHGGVYTYAELPADEFGERDTKRVYCDLNEIVDGLQPYEAADVFLSYVMSKGLEQVNQCRAAQMAEQETVETKSLKSAIEEVVRASKLAA